MEKEIKEMKLKVTETIGAIANEVSEIRKDVKDGKRDRKILNDVLAEGRFLMSLVKTKMTYDKDNGRKPKIKMLDALQL